MSHWTDEVAEIVENLKQQGITDQEVLNQIRFAYKQGYDNGRYDQKEWERNTK